MDINTPKNTHKCSGTHIYPQKVTKRNTHQIPRYLFPASVFLTFFFKKAILKTTCLSLSFLAINFKEGRSIVTRILNMLIFEEGGKKSGINYSGISRHADSRAQTIFCHKLLLMGVISPLRKYFTKSQYQRF